MTKRDVIRTVLDGKKPPYVPWSFKFTVEPKEMLCKYYGVNDLDEVLGKVADENLELMKFLHDKIAEMFDKVFMITHNELIKGWGNNVVKIEKNNNISQLKFIDRTVKAQA